MEFGQSDDGRGTWGQMDLADGKPYCPKGLGGKAMAILTVYGYVL